MRVTFYGVRGSIPVSGEETVKYGGSTSCIHIRLNSGRNIVLDSGTGIRKLGQTLMADQDPVFLLVTHNHWDHIHGFPFFVPIYQKGRQVLIYMAESDIHGQLCSLLAQMDGAHFPVAPTELESETQCFSANIMQELSDYGINVTRRPINHPGGGSAYLIEEDGVSCAYITDNELVPPYKPRTSYEEWVQFCSGIDLLVHDAQYLEADMPTKHGWGHSLVSQARQLALDANVKSLALFHHDPDRTDAELEQIGQETQTFFARNGNGIKALVAAEGLCITI